MNFPSEETYKGNKPYCRGHKSIYGGFTEIWRCRYGEGEVYKGELISGTFSFNLKVTIYIAGDSLCISNMRHSSSPRIWEYLYNHNGMPTGVCYSKTHLFKMSVEEAEKIVGKEIKDCLFWDIFQGKAKYLFYKSLEGQKNK